MCGRFALTLPVEALAHLFEAAPGNDLPQGPTYNICPTNDIVTVLGGGEAGARRLAAMRWGFLPGWYKHPADGPLLINARSETIAEKPAFRAACRQRRCLIPASGFFEWTKDADGARLPWYIHRRDGAPLVFAGVWQEWEAKQPGPRLTTCAVVTCAANETMSAIHHRMPVIVEPSSWAKWLGEARHGAATLMRPAAEDVLQFHRVGSAVNSNRSRGPSLIAPLAA